MAKTPNKNDIPDLDKEKSEVSDKEGAPEVQTPAPNLLYSDEDLQKILDEHEKERLRILEEEINKSAGKLPLKIPQQSAAEYISQHRTLINEHSQSTFARIMEVNRTEHERMQKGGDYKSINFNKNTQNPAPLEIKNKSGKVLHELKYKTDGQLIIANVPKNVSEGPMHLSLALQDVNGENIEADKALYFNISYGPDGKIKSMNYPEPLEFEGDQCKFMVGTQPYYLKVDKATLDVLSTELTKNHLQEKKLAPDIGGEKIEDDVHIIKAKEINSPPMMHSAKTVILAEQSPAALEHSGEFQLISHLKQHAKVEPQKPALQATVIPVNEVISPPDPDPEQALVYSSSLLRPHHAAQSVVTEPANVAKLQAVLKPIVITEEIIEPGIPTTERAFITKSDAQKFKKQKGYNIEHLAPIEEKTEVTLNPEYELEEVILPPIHKNKTTSLKPSPKQNSQDFKSELAKKQEVMRLRVEENNKTGKYNSLEKKQLSNLADETPDFEMPSLHQPAKKLAESLTQMLKKTEKESEQKKSGSEFKSPKDIDGKWVVKQQTGAVLAGAVKAQHSAAKPSGDSAHKQFAIPEDGEYKTPKWQKDLKKKNELARALRDSSPSVDPAPKISPGAAGKHSNKEFLKGF